MKAQRRMSCMHTSDLAGVMVMEKAQYFSKGGAMGYVECFLCTWISSFISPKSQQMLT